MAQLSLQEAARQTGLHRSTLHRAIQRGRLSATLTEAGDYRIDPAELFRAYPPKAEGEPVFDVNRQRPDVARQEKDGRAPNGDVDPATTATTVIDATSAVHIAKLEGELLAKDREILTLREMIARLDRP